MLIPSPETKSPDSYKMWNIQTNKQLASELGLKFATLVNAAHIALNLALALSILIRFVVAWKKLVMSYQVWLQLSMSSVWMIVSHL